ncbi:uncharacterized protein LOC119705912 [Motacilla alba alba]|uniref:uncharacterized protein LOC119705912 n=1 Tax=Motacilla alba alba TaxID=1094192 RepID=UPI0018D51431|nr:uncharacterized protein LOC119705912 [Motacilla alba alba]
MPVFSLPSVSSLTSDLHVKPCLHTSPPPLAPPTPALGQRQKEEFSPKEDKGGEGDCGIPGFISACHRDFANPSPMARRSCRVCSPGRNGKGLRDPERAAGFIRHLPRSHRRREARPAQPRTQGAHGTSPPAAGERGARRERRRCGLQDEPSPAAAHRAPAGCGDVQRREYANGYGIAQCGDGSGDTGRRGHSDDREDVGQHDAGMAAGTQGRADA